MDFDVGMSFRIAVGRSGKFPLEKEQQERRPLLSINDHFRKIVIVGDDIHRKEDELGVLTIGLLDFLTDKNLLEQG